MKHAKKLLALALAFAMALALAVPAFAAETMPPTVTVDLGGYSIDVPLDVTAPGNAAGDIESHDFKAYQIFAAEYAEQDGNDVMGNANNLNGSELVAIKWGSGVDVAKLWNLLDTAESSPVKGQLSAITEDPIATGGNSQINPAAYELAKLVANFSEAEAKEFANLVDQCVTGEGYATGTKLPAGYYLVVDVQQVNGADVRNPAILQMSIDGPFVPTVKANVPQLDKSVLQQNDSNAVTQPEWGEVADYDINDNVPFLLTSTLPSNYADYETYSYIIKDTLSAGLTYKANTMQIFVDGVELTGITPAVVTNADNGITELTIDFGDLKTTAPAATADSVIRVVYTATLNEDAVIGNGGNKNTAHLEFSNNPNVGGEGETGTTPDDIVTVLTFQLNVNKVKEDTTATDGTSPLQGAGFTLYKKYAVTPTNHEQQLEAGSNYYQVGEEQMSAENGTLAFKGLDAGEYMLRETTVPDGFNPAEDIYFEVKATLNNDGTVAELTVEPGTDKDGNPITNLDGTEAFPFEKDEIAGTLTTSVLNLSGLRLPSTGGIGTTIFYVVGGLLLVGAAVVLITKKRMSSAE